MYKTKNYSKIVAHFHQWDFICNQLKITSTQFSWCGPLAQEASGTTDTGVFHVMLS